MAKLFGCGMCRRAKRLRVSTSVSTPSRSLQMVPASQRGVKEGTPIGGGWQLQPAKIPDFHAGVFMPSAGEGIKLLKGEVQPSPFEGHANEVKSVAYSADRKQVRHMTLQSGSGMSQLAREEHLEKPVRLRLLPSLQTVLN